jgi:Big-like domain-containing protein
MVVGFNSYVGPVHPQVYRDPLTYPFADTSLGDFYSHAYSARLDSLNNLYVLDLTRNHVLIYRAKDPPAPVVLSITRANPSPISALHVSFNVTFSETVLGVDSSDFALNMTGITDATIIDVGGTGATRQVVVNIGPGTGTIGLAVVDNDSIRNEDNNRPLGNIGVGNGDFTNGEIYMVVFDDTPPNAPLVTAPVGFISNITPTISGTAEADSQVNIWYRDNSNILVKICNDVLTDGSGNWSCESSVTLPERGIQLTVQATDAAGNTSNDTTYSFTIDLTAPAAPVVKTPTGTINDSTPLISGAAEADNKVNVWYQNGATWQLVCSNVTASGSGAWSCESSVTLSAGSVELKVNTMDPAGNQSTDTTHFFTLKLNPPSVTSIVRASANPTSAESVNFTVTFSESVKDVDINDFSLITSGQITGASVSGVTGSEASYTVSVSSGSHTGAIRLDVPNSATVTDLVGNVLSNLPFTSGETYTIFMRDGMATTGVFRPSNGLLYLKNRNESGFADAALNYGLPGDYPVVGDWDGNGTVTIGVYRDGYFYLKNSNTLGFAEVVFPFGQPGDQPIAGDWDGDGVDTIGVYRPSTGQFLLRNENSEGPSDKSFYLGNVGDVGIAGDWDGDGLDTTGVFRPSNGVIFLKNKHENGFADVALNYGLPGDQPVTGDWNNDGIDTIGVYRNGQFMLRNSNTIGFAEVIFGLGNPGDMPIAGNWDGLP